MNQITEFFLEKFQNQILIKSHSDSRNDKARNKDKGIAKIITYS